MDSEMAEEEEEDNDVSFRLETEVTTQLIAEFISQTPCWENIEVGAICAIFDCIVDIDFCYDQFWVRRSDAKQLGNCCTSSFTTFQSGNTVCSAIFIDG